MRYIADETALPIISAALQHDLDSFAWAIDAELDIDFDFYRSILANSPGIAMDAGCGTGRLLIEYLKLGFHVEACDICPIMVALCKEKAAAAGFSPTVLHLSIQELNFTDRYSVIFLACGTLMCITDEAEVDLCLTKLFENLAPGGKLVLSIMPPSPHHELPGPFPSPWEHYYDVQLPGDLGELTVEWRSTGIDCLNQIISEENRYRLIQNGAIVREELSPGKHRWHTAEQLTARLRRIGFSHIDVHWDYAAEPGIVKPGAVMCFVATRA